MAKAAKDPLETFRSALAKLVEQMAVLADDPDRFSECVNCARVLEPLIRTHLAGQAETPATMDSVSDKVSRVLKRAG